jgi:hypothetical protein
MDKVLMERFMEISRKGTSFLFSAMPATKNRQFEYFSLDRFPNRVYHKGK